MARGTTESNFSAIIRPQSTLADIMIYRSTVARSGLGCGRNHEYIEHMLLLSKLDPVNHSDDETDVEGPRRRSRGNRFGIIMCGWISTGLRELLVIPAPLLPTLGTPAVGLWRDCSNEAPRPLRLAYPTWRIRPQQ